MASCARRIAVTRRLRALRRRTAGPLGVPAVHRARLGHRHTGSGGAAGPEGVVPQVRRLPAPGRPDSGTRHRHDCTPRLRHEPRPQPDRISTGEHRRHGECAGGGEASRGPAPPLSEQHDGVRGAPRQPSPPDRGVAVAPAERVPVQRRQGPHGAHAEGDHGSPPGRHRLRPARLPRRWTRLPRSNEPGTGQAHRDQHQGTRPADAAAARGRPGGSDGPVHPG